MRRLLLLCLLLAAPAVAQTVTIDFGALNGVRRSHPRLVVADLPALARLDVPPPLPLPADLSLAPRRSDAARALLNDMTPATALLALRVAEPPRPLQSRLTLVELARFVPHLPARVAPSPPARIDMTDPPSLTASRLLLSFAPDLSPPPLRDPVMLREAMVPALSVFSLLDRVSPLALPTQHVATTLHFAPATASLDADARGALDTMVEAMAKETDRSRRAFLRVSLRSGDDPDAARRLALSRMLAVRAYLISRGVVAAGLDARASVTADGDETARIALSD